MYRVPEREIQSRMVAISGGTDCALITSANVIVERMSAAMQTMPDRAVALDVRRW